MCSLFILGSPTLKYGIYASLMAILTYFSSAVFYSNHDTGALWCYYVVFFLFCIIYIEFFKKLILFYIYK